MHIPREELEDSRKVRGCRRTDCRVQLVQSGSALVRPPYACFPRYLMFAVAEVIHLDA